MKLKDKHAFPHLVTENNAINISGGLTIREYYAAETIKVVFNNKQLHTRMWDYSGGRRDEFNSLMAKKAVSLADALIAELESEGEK